MFILLISKLHYIFKHEPNNKQLFLLDYYLINYSANNALAYIVNYLFTGSSFDY